MAQGIDVRQTTGRLQFRVLLLDSAGAVVTTGTTNLRLYELQDGGTLESYDFSSNTFKTTALTTENLAMTHRTGNNGTTNTGIWTADLTTLTGFVVGSVYFIWVTNSGASPPVQVREFQFGNAEGDMTVTSARLNVDVKAINADTNADDRLAAALTTSNGIDVNMGQATPGSPTANTTGEALRFAHEDLPNQVAAGANGGLPLLDANLLVNSDLERVQGSATSATNLTNALATSDGVTISPTQAPVAGGAGSTGEAIRRSAISLPNEIAPGTAGGVALAGATYGDLDSVVSAISGGASTLLVSSTSTASSTVSQIYLASVPGTDANDDYDGMLLIIRDASDGNRPSVHTISNYTAASNICDITPNCRFTPANGDPVQIWSSVCDPTVTTELLKVTTGFSASSPNNLNSYLKSMMSSVATVPSGVGTYSPATDALEVLRERLDLITGTGFNTATDSLAAIRDAIDDLIAPAISVGGGGTAGIGFLSECISLIRQFTDEPSVEPKYTNNVLIEYIHSAFDQVLSAVNIDSDHPILVRHDVAVVNGTQEYVLPCSVGEIWRIARIDTVSRLPVWELWPSNEFTFSSYGFTVEGNVLRFGSPQVTTQTLQVLYMPNSEVAIHTATAVAGSTTTIEFPASPTEGVLDIRPHGYAGYMVRLLDGTGEGQERVVESYNATTRVATVRPAWTTAPNATSIYEALPQYSRLIKHVVVLYAALDVLAGEAKSTRRAEIERVLQRKMTALRNTLGKKVNRFGTRGPGVDTIDNSDLWPMVP